MSPTVAEAPVRTHTAPLRTALERVFSIDLRSLAAFRIGIGALLLYDLVVRVTHMAAHYSDAGAVPRSVVRALTEVPVLSLHMLSGSIAWQSGLFIAAAGAAVCLLVGYRTRIAAVASWILLLSLHVRNPWVLNSGDALLLNLLLWATFLPLGARWSLDAAMARADAGRSGTRSSERPRTVFSESEAARTASSEPPRAASATRPRTASSEHLQEATSARRQTPSFESAGPRIVSVATAGILLQMCAVYFASVFHKTAGPWVGEFTAVYYALNIDAYATAFGTHVANAPLMLLGIVTVATLLLEVSGPMLALSPIQNEKSRMLCVAAFTLFHLGLAATLHLGIFSFVCMAGWLLFLPSSFWERRRPDEPDEHAPPPARHLSRTGIVAASMLAAICAFLTLASIAPSMTSATSPTTVTSAAVEPVTSAAEALRIRQSWKMFAPYPATNDGWYAITGFQGDGRAVNLFDPAREPVVGKPRLVSEIFVDQRWRKFFFDHYRSEKWEPHRAVLLDLLVRRWNARNPDRPVQRAEVRIINEPSCQVGCDPVITEEVLATYP